MWVVQMSSYQYKISSFMEALDDQGSDEAYRRASIILGKTFDKLLKEFVSNKGKIKKKWQK